MQTSFDPEAIGRPSSATRPARVTSVWALLAVLAIVATAACTGTATRRVVEGEVESHTEGTFYAPPSPLPAGAPGALIRAEDLLGAPDGARAWRVLYHSRDVLGADIAVSGIVVAPDGTGGGNRAVVAWAHPTTGAAASCAPSVGPAPFSLIEGLKDLLHAGYVVTASDYPGMGTDGPPSYLIGTSEGNSVLDSVRAARQIPETGAGDQLLLWGHSQGGQAALFAAQDATSYAPELRLTAVAVAAPAVELGSLLNDDIGDDSGVSLGAYAFDAYQRVYGPSTPALAQSQILTPDGVAATPKMAALCLFGQHDELHAIAGPLVGNYLKANPADVAPWSTLLAQNMPGTKKIGVPMLVAQGSADTLVRPATTLAYVQKLCASGEKVDGKVLDGIGHGLVALRAVPTVLTTFADALAGKPPTTTC